MSQKMPEGAEILFINKTAQSGKLSQSRGSERARIYSHVQRGSHTQGSSKVPVKGEVLYQLPESWMWEPGRDRSNSPSDAHQRQRSKPRARKAKPQVQTAAAVDALKTLQLSAKPQQLVSLNRWSGGVGDPFDSLKATMDPYMEDLFKFCECQYLEARSFLLSRFPDSSDIVSRIFPIRELANTARQYTLTQAFEDPLQRDTLLCTTSAAIYADSGLNRYGITALTFKGKALVSLQRQLAQRKRSDNTSFSSMYAVALLLFVEVSRYIPIAIERRADQHSVSCSVFLVMSRTLRHMHTA